MPKIQANYTWGNFDNHQQHFNVFSNVVDQNYGQINFFMQFCHMSVVLRFFCSHHTSKFWASYSFAKHQQ